MKNIWRYPDCVIGSVIGSGHCGVNKAVSLLLAFVAASSRMLEDLERLPYVITQQPGISDNVQESEDFLTRSKETSSDSYEDSGIRILDGVKEVIVKQRVHMLEVVTSIDMNNKYDVYDPTGKKLFYAYEQSPCLLRFFMGRQHGLTLHVADIGGQDVIRIRRQWKFCHCISNELTKLCVCCRSCREIAFVESPPGIEKIGYVSQTCGTRLQFNVFDRSGRIAEVVGPSYCGLGCCTCCFPTKEFKICSNDGEHIGAITKLFGGVFKELFTNADVFHVEFPSDMSVQGKALLLATVFLIDYIAFEDCN